MVGHDVFKVGDPTPIGWFTAFVYLIAAFCAMRQYRAHRKLELDARFWLVLVWLLVILGINKQLDIQGWFIDAMKQDAIRDGWYQYRTHFQVVFVIAMGLGLVALLLALRLYLINSWQRYKITWIGLVLLFCFIVIRGASFSHVDILINRHVMGIELNVVLELSALLLVIVGTFFHKKLVPPIIANTLNVRNYVEIANEGDPVKCPNCGTPPLSRAIDGRQFKCRKCSHHYHVRKV